MDRSDHIVEDIKWKLFNKEKDFNLMLEFADWCGDGHSFIVKDYNGNEYRVCVTKEDE